MAFLCVLASIRDFDYIANTIPTGATVISWIFALITGGVCGFGTETFFLFLLTILGRSLLRKDADILALSYVVFLFPLGDPVLSAKLLLVSFVLSVIIGAEIHRREKVKFDVNVSSFFSDILPIKGFREGIPLGAVLFNMTFIVLGITILFF